MHEPVTLDTDSGILQPEPQQADRATCSCPERPVPRWHTDDSCVLGDSQETPMTDSVGLSVVVHHLIVAMLSKAAAQTPTASSQRVYRNATEPLDADLRKERRYSS